MVCPEYYPLFFTAIRADFTAGSWLHCSGVISSSIQVTVDIYDHLISEGRTSRLWIRSIGFLMS
jgi:hypothetical protein